MFNTSTDFNQMYPYGGSGQYPQSNLTAMNSMNSMNTNVYKVTSLEEAIMRTNARNGEMVYFNQNKDEFYVVRVDGNGNKSWQTFSYTLPNPNVNVPVNRADFDALVARIDKFEEKFKETSDESNG